MIKEKFLKVLYWLRDHFHFLLEVVVRLSLGIEKKLKQPNPSEETEDIEKEDDYDK